MKKCNCCKNLLDEKNFNKNRVKKDGLNGSCKECRKVTDRKYYKKNRIEHGHKVRVNRDKRIKILKQKISDIKSKGCKYCPEKDERCLQFHHLRDKKFEISKAVYWGLSWDKIYPEIKKCDIVCSNCHFKLHSNL